MDFSAGQLQKAERNLRANGVHAAGLLQGDAQRLPFPSDMFDFAYSINVFHHLPSPEAQLRAAQEVIRVLRPGGMFFLHEMNTVNPVFRLYMGYVFPLLKQIDEGTEQWIIPSRLPPVAGGTWLPNTEYLTFMPDFIPIAIQNLLKGAERSLERSAARRYSAHYQACLVKAE
jgi:SAM-dependent methyltransferase